MRTLILAFFLLCTPPVQAAETITVSVPDITCEVCAQTITAALSKEDAVQNVDVDVEKRTVMVTLKDGQTLSKDAISALIKKSGFTPAL